jgi:hypothetical protein
MKEFSPLFRPDSNAANKCSVMWQQGGDMRRLSPYPFPSLGYRICQQRATRMGRLNPTQPRIPQLFQKPSAGAEDDAAG